MSRVAIAAGVVVYNRSSKQGGPLPATARRRRLLPGRLHQGPPASYAGVKAFKKATGTTPDMVMYYSGWYVPFPTAFAATVASDGAAPLVQMDPDGINIARSLPGNTTVT